MAKAAKVEVGDTIVTAGWRTTNLSSLYPKGIAIGKVTSVGQTDTDVYKQVQVQPFADFTSIDAVIVLVRKARRDRCDQGRSPRLPRLDRAGVDARAACVDLRRDTRVLLVTLVCVALLRGSITGAVAGFAGGLSSTSRRWARWG